MRGGRPDVSADLRYVQHWVHPVQCGAVPPGAGAEHRDGRESVPRLPGRRRESCAGIPECAVPADLLCVDGEDGEQIN